MDYGKLCTDLLELDNKIRYVGVYNSFSGDVYEKMQKLPDGKQQKIGELKLEKPIEELLERFEKNH